MESNRAEAGRYIDIALQYLISGDTIGAEKFLEKANNLYPTTRSKELLERLRSEDENVSSSSSSPDNKTKTPEKQSSPSHKPNNDYTPDQITIVRQINKCRDFYEVLGVTKNATNSDLKKSYKKLALLLHPDKNRAPGSVEAFKTVAKALATLTDTEKRKMYDLCDFNRTNFNNRPSYRSYHSNHAYEHAYEHAYSTGGGMDSEFTSEEIYNMFFGNGYAQRGTVPEERQYQHNMRPETSTPSLAVCLIILVLLVSIMSSYLTSDPIYSLAQSQKYSVRRNTIHLNIPYYVKERFETEYQGSLPRLENSVEEEYISVMKQACSRERSYRELMMYRAKLNGKPILLEQAQNLPAPSCENLAKIGLRQFYPN